MGTAEWQPPGLTWGHQSIGVLFYRTPAALITFWTRTGRDVRRSVGITPSLQERECLKLPPLFLEFQTDNRVPTSLARLFLYSSYTCTVFFSLICACFPLHPIPPLPPLVPSGIWSSSSPCFFTKAAGAGVGAWVCQVERLLFSTHLLMRGNEFLLPRCSLWDMIWIWQGSLSGGQMTDTLGGCC